LSNKKPRFPKRVDREAEQSPCNHCVKKQKRLADAEASASPYFQIRRAKEALQAANPAISL
jgi:hypothetical protein